MIRLRRATRPRDAGADVARGGGRQLAEQLLTLAGSAT
jgi:hypothetical protein